jgi:hypothetical protein
MSRRGFLIENNRGHYFVRLLRKNGTATMQWTPDPSFARVFPSIFDAKREVKILGRAYRVWQLDESLDRYYLTTVR